MMKKLISLYAIIMMTLLSACSTTSNVAVEKKPLLSDHYLLLSLINRPVTADQQIMLAFAEQNDNDKNPFFVNSIEMKGPTSSTETSTLTSQEYSYSNLISQDYNAVRIIGPK